MFAQVTRFEDSPSDLETVLAQIEKVTAEDVQRVAADLIHADALRLAVIGPFDDAERFEKLL